MLTPKFRVNQDDNFLLLEIRVPFGKLAEGEIYIEENNFIFYAKPYYLRLNFSGKLLDNGTESVTYNSEEGLCTVQIPKANPGEIFSDLEMLTKLLTPQKTKNTAQIEVINEEIVTDQSGAQCDEIAEDNEWLWEQEVYVDEEVTTTSKYGFANKYQGIFKRLQGELPDAVDVKDPDDKSKKTRSQERLDHERNHFSDDHYLADLYEDDNTQEILKFNTRWKEQEPNNMSFDEEERGQLASLPKREYLLDATTTQTLMLGLVDVLFAYAYDRRTTFGEGTVETSWNICKLSATLSWLHCFRSLTEVVVSSVRRSLCYPLYRHWDLAIAVLQDTADLLEFGGPIGVVKALLVIHKSLSTSEYYYIINEIYVLDYLIWTQYLSSKDLLSLAKALRKISITKADVGLDLFELESAGKMALQESCSNKLGKLQDKMKDLALRNELDSDDDVS